MSVCVSKTEGEEKNKGIELDKLVYSDNLIMMPQFDWLCDESHIDYLLGNLVWAQRHYPTKWVQTRTLGIWVEEIIIPQFDWLCDMRECVMSPTLGIYRVDLGFINNYKESQL